MVKSMAFEYYTACDRNQDLKAASCTPLSGQRYERLTGVTRPVHLC
jgi:hypothetical protein